MRPLRELQALLTKTEPTRGVIVAIDGTNARVATPNGLVIAQAAASVTAGQQVTLRGGIAYPRQTRGRLYRL